MGRYWTCGQPGGGCVAPVGFWVSHRCPRSRRPLPCPPGGMWPPQQPQPLPGAHLALTFPGAPSMPAGCHSKSKSYKQNEEKSLISIYSNEPCNNANHKSRSHCYSISVSYPSPQHFPRVSRLLAAFTSPFPAWGHAAGREGTVPTTWGAPGPQSPPPSPRCPLNLGWPLPCSQTPRSSITRGRIRAGS